MLTELINLRGLLAPMAWSNAALQRQCSFLPDVLGIISGLHDSGTISPCDLGTRYLTATTSKACASSPSGQEQPNFGPICPPYGSIIRAWNPCGMASKNLEMNRTFALSSTPSLRWHGPPVQTAPQIL